MDKLMKLMEKKKKEGKEMDPLYKKSKMSMLESLRDEMSGMMKDDLHPEMKKVEVASPDSEGLKEGLDKAKQIVDAKSEEESPEHGAMESPEKEASEHDEKSLMEAYHADPSKENLEKLMECLEAKKSMMS